MEEIFKETDKNHDGVIVPIEIDPDNCPGRVDNATGIDLPKELFDHIDINKDGNIDREEMKKSKKYLESKRCKISIKVG